MNVRTTAQSKPSTSSTSGHQFQKNKNDEINTDNGQFDLPNIKNVQAQ